MKQLLLHVMISGLFLFCRASWQQIGPYGGNLQAVAVAPSHSNIIYCSNVSNPTMVFKSTDAGETWDLAGSVQYYLYDLAVDPIDPDIIYGCADGSVYRSIDGGATWTSGGVSGILLNEIVIDPEVTSTLYTVGIASGGNLNMGFFKSTDSGTTWTKMALNSYSGRAFCVALDPSDPSTLYIGGDYTNSGQVPSVYKSTDNGNTFSEITTGIDPACRSVHALRVDATTPAIVYAGTEAGGIYRSTNSGHTWALCSAASILRLKDIRVLPDAPGHVYASCYTTIYKSTDHGNTWSECSNGLHGYDYNNLAVHCDQTARIYTISTSGFFLTSNSGTNWSPSHRGINQGMINTFTHAHSQPETMLAQFNKVGVYKTTDGGNSWMLLPQFSSCGNIASLAMHTTDPDIMFCLNGSG
jgi:photosystem II stability/assembly factor-like uncharacterized protein